MPRQQPVVRPASAGFTLIEVLVSIVVLMIIFVGTLHYFTNSRAYVETGMRQQQAWISMTSQLERAISIGYDSVLDSLPEVSTPLDLHGIRGYRTTTVTPIDDPFDDVDPTDTEVPDYLEITVYFSWFTTDNITDSVTFCFSPERSWDY